MGQVRAFKEDTLTSMKGVKAPLLGAHMSVAGGKHLAVGRALEVDSTVLQIFVKNASRWNERALKQQEIQAFAERRQDSGLSSIVAHDSYLVNLASPSEPLWRKSIDALLDEMERAEILGLDYLVAHPGAHVDSGEASGIKRIGRALDIILGQTRDYRVRIALETTAGQGSTLGYRFEQLRDMLAACKWGEKIDVCLDTCHVFAAGYDIRDEEGCSRTFGEFDRTIGLDRLRLFHFNDSVKGLGTRVDRHAHIGQGEIGVEAFRWILNQETFTDVPKILETPKENGPESDRRNLDLLRSLVDDRAIAVK